jgi:hypothetical protein
MEELECPDCASQRSNLLTFPLPVRPALALWHGQGCLTSRFDTDVRRIVGEYRGTRGGLVKLEMYMYYAVCIAASGVSQPEKRRGIFALENVPRA